MDRFSVVVAGGGVAALEALLRIRRLLGDEARITLLAPNDDFRFRAWSVGQPFSAAGAVSHPVRHIAGDAGAELVKDRLAWVDTDAQVAHSEGGTEHPYDALLVAVGGRLVPAFEHVTTFRDDKADELLHGTVQDIEAGYTTRVAFVAPDGPIWPLPLYELALMTAERAAAMGIDEVELTLVTPEATALASFGSTASDAVAGLLADAGIAVHAGTSAEVPAGGTVRLGPGGEELTVDRIVAMPRVTGPAIRGIPGLGASGFVPIDVHCVVPSTGGRVFAAGDATDFPIKHGGLGAMQADTAAAGIAALAGGGGDDVSRFEPVIHGMLLTGDAPLYMRARIVGGEAFDSEVSHEPLWDQGEKVVASELGERLGAR